MSHTVGVGCSQCGASPIEARGLCNRHYQQWWQGADIPAPLVRVQQGKYTTCTKPGCDKPHKSKGLCLKHYKHQKYGIKPRKP